MLQRALDEELLLKSSWLGTRSKIFQDELLSYATPKSFGPGEALYHHGDPANGIYAVLSGGVNVTAPADDGQEFVIHREGAGFWIGDLALFAGAQRLVSVVTAQATQTLFFPSSRIERLVLERPEFIRDFYALTHENMQTVLRIMANLAVMGTEKRLVLRLLHLDEGTALSDGWIAVSQDELAAMIAVSPLTIHRILHRLENLDLIEIGYGKVRLINKVALIASCQS